MKSRDEVTAEKLRGGFYTPDALVDLCLSRIARLTRGRTTLRVLEPSVGDGAFIRGIARSPLRDRIDYLQALEVFDVEARKSTAALKGLGARGSVLSRSTIDWAATTDEQFDVAVGNPPFVRFQFVSPSDRESTDDLGRRLDLSFGGVANLWLPVIIGALSRLRTGGAFAFVIPAECFTGISAAALRNWLVHNVSALRFDLFAPNSFPDVLQEVVVLSGRREDAHTGPAACTICEHPRNGRPTSTKHSIPTGCEPWTRYLLTKNQLTAVEEASSLSVVSKLGALAQFEVAAVTGANDYFSVDSATVDEYALHRWTRPLLPRLRHAPGLRHTRDDQAAADASGAKVHLLDFAKTNEDPRHHPKAAEYLRAGVDEGLHLRYKCRIRDPWYRVPSLRTGELMLSKRSHHYPRVVLNDADVVTTDTIYRGRAKGELVGRAADLVASFHNSLTLVSAELEGRSFGGGVLELVPSEVARLSVPFVKGFGGELDRLDNIARCGGDSQALVDETDLLLTKADIGLDQHLLDEVRDARLSLLTRRLDRNS